MIARHLELCVDCQNVIFNGMVDLKFDKIDVRVFSPLAVESVVQNKCEMYGNKSRFSLSKMQFCKHLVDVILRDSIWLSGTCTLVSDVSLCHEQDNALCTVLFTLYPIAKMYARFFFL